MQSPKRTTLGAVILAALGTIGASELALAVHVNPAGLGQALIYPYYTTRSGAGGGRFNTYLSVVNTTPATKAIKIRFLEGKNGRDVLNFNVYLSPLDTWTAAVIAATNGAGSQLITSDNSCMVPSVKALPFLNYAYTGPNADGETESLDRANEGYFEILELGELIGTITTGLKHNSIGVPANCAVLGGSVAALSETNVVPGTNVVASHGGLTGSATLINPTIGTAFGYEPTVLDDWNGMSTTWTPAGSLTPDLSFASPPVSKVFDGNRLILTDWTSSPNAYDAVSAVLMHFSVINEYMMDMPTQSRSEWVVTFPTKRGYVGKDTVVNGVWQHTAAMRPFQSNFGNAYPGGACDDTEVMLHDREEFNSLVSFPVGVPPPYWLYSPQLCWAANVISYRALPLGTSNILGSANLYISAGTSLDNPYIRTQQVPTQAGNGWAQLRFRDASWPPTAHKMVAPASATTVMTIGADGTTWATIDATYFGLPVIGLGVQTYTNSVAGGSMYGGRFNHKYTRLIQP